MADTSEQRTARFQKEHDDWIASEVERDGLQVVAEGASTLEQHAMLFVVPQSMFTSSASTQPPLPEALDTRHANKLPSTNGNNTTKPLTASRSTAAQAPIAQVNKVVDGSSLTDTSYDEEEKHVHDKQGAARRKEKQQELAKRRIAALSRENVANSGYEGEKAKNNSRDDELETKRRKLKRLVMKKKEKAKAVAATEKALKRHWSHTRFLAEEIEEELLSDEEPAPKKMRIAEKATSTGATGDKTHMNVFHSDDKSSPVETQAQPNVGQEHIPEHKLITKRKRDDEQRIVASKKAKTIVAPSTNHKRISSSEEQEEEAIIDQMTAEEQPKPFKPKKVKQLENIGKKEEKNESNVSKKTSIASNTSQKRKFANTSILRNTSRAKKILAAAPKVPSLPSKSTGPAGKKRSLLVSESEDEDEEIEPQRKRMKDRMILLAADMKNKDIEKLLVQRPTRTSTTIRVKDMTKMHQEAKAREMRHQYEKMKTDTGFVGKMVINGSRLKQVKEDLLKSYGSSSTSGLKVNSTGSIDSTISALKLSTASGRKVSKTPLSKISAPSSRPSSRSGPQKSTMLSSIINSIGVKSSSTSPKSSDSNTNGSSPGPRPSNEETASGGTTDTSFASTSTTIHKQRKTGSNNVPLGPRKGREYKEDAKLHHAGSSSALNEREAQHSSSRDRSGEQDRTLRRSTCPASTASEDGKDMNAEELLKHTDADIKAAKNAHATRNDRPLWPLTKPSPPVQDTTEAKKEAKKPARPIAAAYRNEHRELRDNEKRPDYSATFAGPEPTINRWNKNASGSCRQHSSNSGKQERSHDRGGMGRREGGLTNGKDYRYNPYSHMGSGERGGQSENGRAREVHGEHGTSREGHGNYTSASNNHGENKGSYRDEREGIRGGRYTVGNGEAPILHQRARYDHWEPSPRRRY
jgi:hypothetical protein